MPPIIRGPNPAKNRSVVSNGRLHLNRVADGRTAHARRLKDLIFALGEEVGGFDTLGEGDRWAVRSAAALILRLEQQQAALARGDEVDPDLLIRLNSEARRALDAVRKRDRSSLQSEPALQAFLAEWDPAP
jgi:hypothetical protein